MLEINLAKDLTGKMLLDLSHNCGLVNQPPHQLDELDS